jgi:hypothetical protein
MQIWNWKNQDPAEFNSSKLKEVTDGEAHRSQSATST